MEQKKEKGEEEVVDSYWEQKEKLRVAEYDAGVARQTIAKEKIELHNLLNPENVIIKKGTREEYQKYLDRMEKIKKEKEAVTPA